MKKFFSEFKKFITRGNVVDMAVGVIVGSSFTAIVNALSNNILKPIINFLLALVFGKNSLNELFTYLKKVEVAKEIIDETGAVVGTEQVVDLAQSIYIDWGAFINAIINFFLIAIVLFSIVKLVNTLRDTGKTLSAKKLTKEQRDEMKAAGINTRDKEAVAAYFAKKAADEEAAAKAKAEADAEAARLERLANPTTEDLLKEILAELKANK